MPSKANEQLVNGFASEKNLKRIKDDRDRYVVYNGQLKDIIKKAISSEFILPETVEELSSRIMPLNITRKITDKLAGLYTEAPRREPKQFIEGDAELIDLYEGSMTINKMMKFGIKMMKLHKHMALEPYVSSKGIPKLRVLPSHTYTVLGEDPIEPERVTAFIKHIDFNSEKSKQVHAVWRDDSFFLINGEGEVLVDEMNRMGNPEMENPYGTIPFIYVRDFAGLELIPISDDDLITMQIAIDLLLTDIAFASKYSSWGVFFATNFGDSKISFNPNSVISVESTIDGKDPDLKSVKNDFDSDAMLRQVEMLISLLLTTKDLSIGSVAGSLSIENAASGVAKMIDRSENIEARKSDISIFTEAEEDLWELISHKLLPVWIDSGLIDSKYVGAFSSDFELSIKYPELRPVMTDKDKLDVEITKLEKGLTTRHEAIRLLNPDMSSEQVDDFLNEIDREKLDDIDFIARNMNGDQQSIEEIELSPGS